MQRSLQLTLGILAITSIAISTTACVPAVAAGAGGAVTNAVYDKRSFKTIMDDSTIENRASGDINEHPDLSDTRIHIHSVNHNVLLTGEVANASERTQVYRLVRNLPKVRKVYNQIRITDKRNFKQESRDVWVMTKVKAALFNRDDLRSGQVKVTVDNNVVYLLGVMPRSQQQMAIDVTRHVNGVAKVVTLFEDVTE